MPKNTKSINSNLFRMLKSHGYEPNPLDSAGKKIPIPDEADVFQFTVRTDHAGDDDAVQGRDKRGVREAADSDETTVTVSIDDNHDLKVYYDSDASKDDNWYNLLKRLKNYAVRNQLGFDPTDEDQLTYDMAKRQESNKDKLQEGKKGLWANIHAKQDRIENGSGERMRKPGSKGAPTAQNFKDAQAGSKNESAEGSGQEGLQQDKKLLQDIIDFGKQNGYKVTYRRPEKSWEEVRPGPGVSMLYFENNNTELSFYAKVVKKSTRIYIEFGSIDGSFMDSIVFTPKEFLTAFTHAHRKLLDPANRDDRDHPLQSFLDLRLGTIDGRPMRNVLPPRPARIKASKNESMAEEQINEISKDTAMSYMGKRMNTDVSGKSPQQIEKMIKGLKGAVARVNDEKPTSPAKKKGVAEGTGPQKGDPVYYGSRLVGWFLGYSKYGKVITEPNYDEMGDEYANRNVYWDKDAVTIKSDKQGVAEGADKDTLTQAVNLYREFSKKYPHKIAVDKSAKAHDLDPNKLNNYIDHGKYRATAKSDQGVAEGSLSGLEVYMDPKDGKVKKYQAKSAKPTTGLDVYIDPKDGKVKKYPAKDSAPESKVMEGYTAAGPRNSINDAVPRVKILVQHSRRMEEGEQRFRNVDRIFIENLDGERIRVPTNNTAMARTFGRLIAEGDKPYGERWNHLQSLAEDYTKLRGAIRATAGHQLDESVSRLMTECMSRQAAIREDLHRLSTHRGYHAYFEGWSPAIMEASVDIASITEMLGPQLIEDSRISEALDVLGRVNSTISENAAIKEVDELAEWADSLLDETIDNEPEALHELDMMDEGSEGDADAIMKDIVSGELQLYDVMNNPSGPQQQHCSEMLHDMYERIAGERGLHADDDYEQIEQLMLDELADNFGGDYASDHTDDMISDPGDDDSEEMVREMDNRTPAGDRREQRAASPEATAERKKKSQEELKKVSPELRKKLRLPEPDDEVKEGLDADQKRAGQLGPTEKIGKGGTRGKLVGANESVDHDLISLRRLSGLK